ncbi:MAG TPA: LysR substrate-binding domain-containing protein [Paucimonas sp.]|nr:LysR substrate-binding domain-containing protein [Paucimonas sp.]
MQQDLNDLYFFAQVVENGGFAAAGRALGLPKSRLSRRIAELEERLGVRLLQRSSRRFAVTEIGQVYLRHCQAMLAEAQAAQEAIDHIQAEPRGQIRVSCPITLAQTLLSGLIGEFMNAYPHVNVYMDVTNRRVDVIEEGYDVALRVRAAVESSNLVMRSFGMNRTTLLASPALLERLGAPAAPNDLGRFPSLSMPMNDGRYVWTLENADGEIRTVEHAPRLIADDLLLLRETAISGVGLAVLPEYLCREAMRDGKLVRVLPQWSYFRSNLHAVFASRRGLLPAVRCFIDFLAKRLPEVASEFGVSDFAPGSRPGPPA